jgi:hypothetical protein
MIVYTNERLPRWWWLNPWRHAKTLHQAVVALAGKTCQQDDLLKILRRDNRRLRELTNSLTSQVREYRDARRERGE